MLLEVIVAGVLVAAVMSICLRMLHATAAAHRAAERRQTAVWEAANVMERLGALSWDELTEQRAAEMQLSQEVRRQLPGGELQIELADTPAEPQARLVVVLVRWQDRSGRFVRPVQLAAFRYPAGSDPIHRVEP